LVAVGVVGSVGTAEDPDAFGHLGNIAGDGKRCAVSELGAIGRIERSQGDPVGELLTQCREAVGKQVGHREDGGARVEVIGPSTRRWQGHPRCPAAGSGLDLQDGHPAPGTNARCMAADRPASPAPTTTTWSGVAL